MITKKRKSDEVGGFIGFSAFHTFGIFPLPITSPFLQCSMMPGKNPISPIAICRIYSAYS